MDNTTADAPSDSMPVTMDAADDSESQFAKNPFLGTLNQIGPARLGIMGGVLFLLLMFFVFVSLRVSSSDMQAVFADLSAADSALLVTKLDEAQIPHEISCAYA